MPRPRWQYILLFFTFLALSLAATPTTFCKCICFSKSTIIPLDSSPSDPSHAQSQPKLTKFDAKEDKETQRPRTRTCNDCNKQFCLDYQLPICKNAEESDVVTTCFQRDSTKDQLVVLLFICATGGLLAWAAVRPWWEKWRDRGVAQGSYAAVGER